VITLEPAGRLASA